MWVGLSVSLAVLQIVVSDGLERWPSVVGLLRLWGELALELLVLLLLLLLRLLSVPKITRGRLLQESGDVHCWAPGAVGGR
jgi:hypothetical protein